MKTSIAIACALCVIAGQAASRAQEQGTIAAGTVINHALTPVTDAHKTSKIVGAKVKDLANQELGEIKDLVADLTTGRIHYVVLSVPMPDGSAKLVAAPPEALTRAAGQDGFLLNTDRNRLLSAAGFSAVSWPPIANSSAWGARAEIPGPATDLEDRVFQEYQAQAAANAAARAALDRSYATHRSDDLDRDGRGVFKGKIVSVNPEKGYLEVESRTGEVRRFMFDDRPTIVLKDSRSPRIVDLKSGYPVNVGYRRVNGVDTAMTIIRTDAIEVK